MTGYRLFFMVAASAALLGATPRQPWQWSLADRLAARESRLAQRLKNEPPGGEAVLHGASEPELFLPFELYDNLLRRAFDEDLSTRAMARSVFTQRDASLAGNGKVWPALERTASSLLASRRAQRREARQLAGAPPEVRTAILARISALQKNDCAARAAAIAEARAALGGERFDRFLYVAVAPDMFIRATSPGDSARLRFIQGGCS